VDKRGKEKGKRPTHLDAEVASVDVVSEEEVAGVGWFAADLEIKLRYEKLAQPERDRTRTYLP